MSGWISEKSFGFLGQVFVCTIWNTCILKKCSLFIWYSPGVSSVLSGKLKPSINWRLTYKHNKSGFLDILCFYIWQFQLLEYFLLKGSPALQVCEECWVVFFFKWLLVLFCFLLFCHMAWCGILDPQWGIEPRPQYWKQSPKPWDAREFLQRMFLAGQCYAWFLGIEPMDRPSRTNTKGTCEDKSKMLWTQLTLHFTHNLWNRTGIQDSGINVIRRPWRS